jgi:hypothetical protein
MKNIKTALALTATVLGLASTAQAGFTNGGFETGDFTGWTVDIGYYVSGSLVLPGNYFGYQGDATVIGSQTDSYSPFDNPFNGTKMARLNSNDGGGFGAARISQTGIMGLGETDIFINWGAVLNDPGHGPSDQPFFNIEVFKNNVLVASESHTAGQAGWTASTSGYSYDSGVFHLAGLAVGDSVKVQMTVADCGQGGHDGWAYLDGIGTVAQQPPPGVPDGGLTALLLAPIFFGLAAIRRRN